ncbi:hypothetical protein BB561_001099 [Smittium simulii]|uniref:Structural maintenance of chromosomes protein n=1 Tax=Smittium simulii TaxID=133385 RepID=A0A2T9YW52_9FUNG|nr:hypothetical protein BB561_001099 [Smittium simulii]
MVQLERIEVENFKSYKGKQTIGPFTSFTAVIGPNGSGKSNLMDAISFVLGVQSSQLRSTQLKDLIYRGPKSGANQIIRRASAAAILSTEAGEISFKRTVTAAGSSEYSINNKIVNFQEYTAHLSKYNILTKAKNFLVFQGDVEAIASQSPIELTRLIETISGSGEYRAEYEKLKYEEQVAAEQSNLSFLKKRAIASELKTVMSQKKELDEYNKKKEELSLLNIEYMLAKLYKVDTQIQQTKNDIDDYQDQLNDMLSKTQSSDKNVLSQRKSQAKAFKELSKADKQVKFLEISLEEKQPVLLGLNETLALTEKKKSNLISSSEKLQDDTQRQKDVIVALESELNQIKKANAKNEEDWLSSKEAKMFSDSTFEAKITADYNKIKSSIEFQSKSDSINQKEIIEKIASLELKINTLLDRKEELSKKIKEKQDQKLSNNKQLQEDLNRLEDANSEKKVIEDKINSNSAKYEKYLSKEFELNEKLGLVLKQISQVKAIEMESKKERKNAEILAVLKRLFQNVYGRISELCKPTQRKYELAALVTLGKFADAIVVDSQKTAIECIQYLREQRAGNATFLPLDSLVVKPLNESFRRAHSGARLVLDILEYNTKYERAIAFVCGSNMVCDSIEIARTLCYDQKLSVKAITLDGVVIHKSGNITGGNFAETGLISNNLAKWERGNTEKLIKSRDDLTQKLTEVSKNKNTLAPIESLQSQLAELDSNFLAAQDNLVRTKRWIETYELEDKDLNKQLSSSEKTLTEYQLQVENLEILLEKVSQKLNKASEPLFRDFCKNYNFSSVSEFETLIKIKNKASKKKIEFSNHVSRLENQLQFEKEQLESIAFDIERTKQLINQNNSELISSQTKIRILEEELSKILVDLKSENNNFLTKQTKYQSETSNLNTLRKEYVELSSALELANRMKSSKETELSKAIDNKLTILRKCRLESIEIPFSVGSLSSVPISLASVAYTSTEDKAQFDNLIINELKPNYTTLPSAAKSNNKKDENQQNNDVDSLEKGYESRIDTLKLELMSMAPSSYAQEKLNTLQRKLNESDSEFLNCRRAAKDVYSRFSRVKQNRLELFNSMFQHISSVIDKFYKILTKSNNFPIGGTAYLNLENTEEPYLSGVKYHAMPPLKRFRDMDHLSGGEKTVAAISLLFALQSFVPSPFFVLDEVDAALDLTNVIQLANYLKLRSSQVALPPLQRSEDSEVPQSKKTTDKSKPDNFQFIVISLKQKLYEKASSLVGVYRDQTLNSSNTLNLSLSDYPE